MDSERVLPDSTVMRPALFCKARPLDSEAMEFQGSSPTSMEKFLHCVTPVSRKTVICWDIVILGINIQIEVDVVV